MHLSNQDLKDLNLHTFLVRHPTATQFVWMDSDAMEAAGINQGALVVVDHSIGPCNGDIVVAVVGEAFMLRAYREEQGRRILYAASKRYRDVEMKEDEEIWGLVVACVNIFRR